MKRNHFLDKVKDKWDDLTGTLAHLFKTSCLYSIIRKAYTYLMLNWLYFLYIAMCILLIIAIIFMIIFEKMGEFDAGTKYLMYPLYGLAFAIFGSSAKSEHEKTDIVIRRREIDSRWANDDTKQPPAESRWVRVVTESHFPAKAGADKTESLDSPKGVFLRLKSAKVLLK